MKVLVVGGGGREHALLWKLHKDDEHLKLYCAPGNGGTEEIAVSVPIEPTDIKGLLAFAKEEAIDFTLVGMDDPLALGIVDEFQKEKLPIFGPTKEAAVLESSKVFAKGFMAKYNIPTAAYHVFNNFEEAKAHCEDMPYPLVIKVDGLAFGKGVTVCEDITDAELFLDHIFINGIFGSSGDKVVIEEYIEGNEVTVLAFCDGKNYKLMPAAQDHKQAFNYDQGPNTGGMGAYAPCPLFDEKVKEQAIKEIFDKTMEGLQNEQIPFVGFLYFGLMLTKDGPKVIEYNARMGDPEAQVIMPLLKTPLLDILIACTEGRLDEIDIEWEDKTALGVVLASGGYPSGKVVKGYEIQGELEEKASSVIFQAGTRKENGKTVTNGGRVLAVVGVGEELSDAINVAYSRVKTIHFRDLFYRTDIGQRVDFEKRYGN